MKCLLTGLAVAAGLTLAAPAGAQQFVQVPGGSWVTDITPNGDIAVGFGNGGAFYWNWRTDPSPTFIGGNDAQAVSDDGSVIVGCIDDPVLQREVAARWTQATGWVSLGWLPNALSCPSRSNAYDVSGDGSKVVGLSWDGCSGRGFIWDAVNGMQELEVMANGGNRASVISTDGTTIGGFAQGNSRTSTFWDAATLAGTVLDVTQGGEVHGFNGDGTIAVGTADQGGANGWYDAYAWTQATGMVNLGSENPDMAGNAVDLSEDGQIIVGYDVAGLARNGWIWQNGLGITDANDYMASVGLTGLPEILVCTAVSDDGGVVTGGFDAGGGGFLSGGFIADIDTGPWLNLGGGTVGFNGVPFLKGDGPLTAGSPATLTLTTTPPNAIMLAWLSFASVPLSAFGGTIHANPFANQFFFFSDATGAWTATVPWPAGIPPGTEVWFQFLVEDVTSIYGIILSNGVKATTP